MTAKMRDRPDLRARRETTVELSQHVRSEIEHWKSRFPAENSRSAVIGALHAAQHENGGYLTAEIMNAVADYLDLPTI